MTERKTQSQTMADSSNPTVTQCHQPPQRTPPTAFQTDPFINTSPSLTYPTLFDDAAASNAHQLGQDQPFFGYPPMAAGTDGVSGGSLISPSFRYFPGTNTTPTGWSPRFNMFGVGTPFGQSPTAGLSFGFSPFGQTPTGLLQPQQLATSPTTSPNRQAFKIPYQPGRPDGDNKLSSTAVGLGLRTDGEGLSPTGPFFPNIYPRDAHPYGITDATTGTVVPPAKTAFQTDPNAARSPSSSSTGQQRQRGAKSGRGRRGRRPSSPILTSASSVGMHSANTEISPGGSSPSVSPMSPGGPHKRLVRRPPPLNVSPRSTELSSTEVSMSSFRLVVGAQKLCKFRRYNVTLTVPKTWRIEHGLTEEKVMKALLDAKCCRSGTSVIAGCPRCKCQPVVTLVSTSKWPQESPTTGTEETYTCSIRTRCSSSRDHLKSSLTLVIDGLPLSQYIVSNSFVLLARDKTQAPKRLRSYEFGQGDVDSDGSEDDEDDDKKSGDGEGSSGELPRKSAHKSNTGTKRRQRRGSESKSGSKPSASTANAEYSQNKAKNAAAVPVKSETTSFPPITTTTFPSTALRQGPGPVVTTTNGNNSSAPNGEGTTGEYATVRENPERLFTMENAPGTAMVSGNPGSAPFSGSVGGGSVSGSSGGKNQSPIQPSSVSLPSPTPCSTPTGILYESITNYDGQPMEQMGWLSPIMPGSSDQQ